MNDKRAEILSDIHHQAAEIQRMVVLCLVNDRIGREWLLKIRHAHDRLVLLMEGLIT